jgi:hypothetical protein
VAVVAARKLMRSVRMHASSSLVPGYRPGRADP